MINATTERNNKSNCVQCLYGIRYEAVQVIISDWMSDFYCNLCLPILCKCMIKLTCLQCLHLISDGRQMKEKLRYEGGKRKTPSNPLSGHPIFDMNQLCVKLLLHLSLSSFSSISLPAISGTQAFTFGLYQP